MSQFIIHFATSHKQSSRGCFYFDLHHRHYFPFMPLQPLPSLLFLLFPHPLLKYPLPPNLLLQLKSSFSIFPFLTSGQAAAATLCNKLFVSTTTETTTTKATATTSWICGFSACMCISFFFLSYYLFSQFNLSYLHVSTQPLVTS